MTIYIIIVDEMGKQDVKRKAGAPGRTVLRTDGVLLGKYDIINKINKLLHLAGSVAPVGFNLILVARWQHCNTYIPPNQY